MESEGRKVDYFSTDYSGKTLDSPDYSGKTLDVGAELFGPTRRWTLS